MRIRYKIFLLFVGVSGVLVFAGCSASSNSMRYSQNNKSTETKTTEEGRYSTNEITANDTDDLPADEKSADISSLTNDSSIKNSFAREKLLMDVVKYLNTPYLYGGDSKSGIDCSAFTQTVYHDCLAYQLPRTVNQQYDVGSPVNGISNLHFGDLVFFNTSKYSNPGHVGIYLGDNLFAHASSSKGVIVSSLNLDYYHSRFVGGRRIRNFFDGEIGESAQR